MKIYADILIITNIYMNFFMLKAVAMLTHTPLKNGRCIFSSVLGGLTALTILIPKMNFLCMTLVKLLGAAAIIALAFGIGDRRLFLRLAAVFWLVSMIFSGTAYLFTEIFRPKFAFICNGVIYLDMSVLTLVTATIVAYMLISLFRFFLDKRVCEPKHFHVVICGNGKTAEIEGLCDTGNYLTDAFTGKPVIVCGKESAEQVIPQTVRDYFSGDHEHIKGVRLIPFQTVGASGLIPAFVPDAVYIKETEGGKIRAVEALIGISETGVDAAVVNPDIFF